VTLPISSDVAASLEARLSTDVAPSAPIAEDAEHTRPGGLAIAAGVNF
jgi:hypothetical protein